MIDRSESEGIKNESASPANKPAPSVAPNHNSRKGTNKHDG